MYFHFLPQKISYDGAQLRSQFILEATGFQGDAVVAFCGPADVGAAHMVDQEDIFASAWIRSRNMLHFIAEHFHMPLAEGVARQRLLVATLNDALRAFKPELNIIRRGDDLFDSNHDQAREPSEAGWARKWLEPRGVNHKLTVSIAAASPQSTCIHTAINIDSQDTPVATRGLDDYKILPMPFALDVLRRYSQECHEISIATCKVKPIL